MNTIRGTQTPHPTELAKCWRALLAALLSALLLATACSNDDERTNDLSTDSSSTDSDSPLGSATVAGASDAAGIDTADVSDEAEDNEAEDNMESEASTPTSGLFAGDEHAAPETKTEQFDGGRDNFFEEYGVRNFVDTARDALSTFALDVDTGSYAITRRWLDEGIKPDPASVRVEEFVNAFEYDYSTPRNGLDIHIDGGPSPFDENNIIIRVGIQAAVIDDRDRANAALTFVVDTSGSMDRDDRLGLVKQALTEMISELDSFSQCQQDLSIQ